MAVTPEQKAERIARANRSVERTKEAFGKLKVRYEKAQTAYEEAVWRRACLDSLPVAGQPASAPSHLAVVPPWEEPATAASDHDTKHAVTLPVAEPLAAVDEPNPFAHENAASLIEQPDTEPVNEIGDTASDVAEGEASAARARVAADEKAYAASLATADEQKSKPQMTKAQKAAVAAARARREAASAAPAPAVDPFGVPTT